jgi:hypothetical protein
MTPAAADGGTITRGPRQAALRRPYRRARPGPLPGSAVALQLTHQGWHVLDVDVDSRLVQDHTGQLTEVAAADTTDEALLRRRALALHPIPRYGLTVMGMTSDDPAWVRGSSGRSWSRRVVLCGCEWNRQRCRVSVFVMIW